MTPPVATVVLAIAESLPRKLKITDAKRVIETWLRARGLPEDRWGNYAITVSEHDKGDDVAAERYHFTDRQLQHQVRFSSGSGDWHNRTSTPVIDSANALIGHAAKALGKVDVLEATKGTVVARKEAVQQRVRTTERKKVETTASVIAAKFVAKKYRADVLKNYTGEIIEPERLAEIKEILAFQKAFFTSVKTLPTDEAFASVDVPPFLPVFGPMTYEWVETVDGVAYTIRVENKAKNKATITIGTSGGMLAVDPYSMSMRQTRQVGAQGDGLISGTLLYDSASKSFMAGLLLIQANGERRAGVGTRMLSLWCRMMLGYGIARWAAIAVGEEGEGFLTALERRGSIKVDRRPGSRTWAVSCTGPARANPGPSVVDGWWG
jgi:hypothetical protein